MKSERNSWTVNFPASPNLKLCLIKLTVQLMYYEFSHSLEFLKIIVWKSKNRNPPSDRISTPLHFAIQRMYDSRSWNMSSNKVSTITQSLSKTHSCFHTAYILHFDEKLAKFCPCSCWMPLYKRDTIFELNIFYRGKFKFC